MRFSVDENFGIEYWTFIWVIQYKNIVVNNKLKTILYNWLAYTYKNFLCLQQCAYLLYYCSSETYSKMLGWFLLPSYVIVADKTFRTKINTYGTHERVAQHHTGNRSSTHNVCYTRNKQRIGCEMVSLFFLLLI